MQNRIWHLILIALTKFWQTEVMPQESAQSLAPIRCYGEVQDIYLA